MKIKFWGTRGSIATSNPKQCEYGGNTSCVELCINDRSYIIDAGTGIRELGLDLLKRKKKQKTIHLFISHYHLDHINGLPFFEPIYQKSTQLYLYGPQKKQSGPKLALSQLFDKSFFPLPLHQIPAQFHYQGLKEEKFSIQGLNIESFFLNHPGNCIAYLFEYQGKRLAYLSDHEPIRKFQHLNDMNIQSYESLLLEKLYELDCLIHDAHFNDKEFPKHLGWGHSPLSYPLQLAKICKIKTLILTHHAPHREDVELRKIAKKFAKEKKIILAKEKMTLTIK